MLHLKAEFWTWLVLGKVFKGQVTKKKTSYLWSVLLLNLLPGAHSSGVWIFFFTGQQVLGSALTFIWCFPRHVAVLEKPHKTLGEIITVCHCNLWKRSRQPSVAVAFAGWLLGLFVRAITTLICISQLHLLCHPSSNQCEVAERCCSLLLRLANYRHRNLLTCAISCTFLHTSHKMNNRKHWANDPSKPIWESEPTTFWSWFLFSCCSELFGSSSWWKHFIFSSFFLHWVGVVILTNYQGCMPAEWAVLFLTNALLTW